MWVLEGWSALDVDAAGARGLGARWLECWGAGWLDGCVVRELAGFKLVSRRADRLHGANAGKLECRSA